LFSGVKVLVTGCSGFLGPWLCQRLLAENAEVIGADIQFEEQSRIHEMGDRIRLVELNVEHFDKIENVLLEHNVQFIFHLAAQALVGKALEQPLATITTNVLGTTNILEAGRRLQNSPNALKGIVVASSDKAYGDHDELPYLESAPMQGRYPYDVSKSCADLIARSYFSTYCLPVTVVRCGNLYGGGDLNWSRIVPGTIRSMLRGEAPIIRSDGTLVRDYIYVEDAVDAILRVGLKHLQAGTTGGDAFNISADKPLSVIELVNMILAVAERTDLTPVIENTATGEIKAQFLSSKRLRESTGWQPLTALQDGLARSVEWYRAKSF
jgi:CDP-glucose 4,6-dehydratase